MTARRSFVLSLPILLAFPLCVFCDEPAQETGKLPEAENFQLYLLIGQSNMAGRGKVEAGDRQVHPRVFTLDQAGEWKPAVDPIHFDKPRVVGVGLGRTFGLEVAAANPDIAVGLIPCAVGGSSIDRWVPGAYDQPTKSHPYDDALRRAKLAMKSGKLCGILWHQGESDSKPEKAETYEANLKALVARLRKELDAAEVPFLIGQLGQFEGRPWNDAKKKVDAAHQNYAAEQPHAAFVSSDGLTHKGDHVHFDAPSYREFGRRYAKTYLEMTNPK
ncbi:MAG: sialate O-acetylesterase [Blastopirellula sp. JB062]